MFLEYHASFFNALSCESHLVFRIVITLQISFFLNVNDGCLSVRRRPSDRHLPKYIQQPLTFNHFYHGTSGSVRYI